MSDCWSNIYHACVNGLDPVERQWVVQAVERIDNLKDQEREVARLFAASRNTRGIAEAMGLATNSVENYVNNIYGELGLTADLQDKPHCLRRAVLLAKAYMIYDLR